MKLSELPFMPNRHRMRIAINVLKERIQGLDFTMPDRLYDRNRNDGAMYYATPDPVLKEIFDGIDKKKYPRFIDIGCGKCYVLWRAIKYGFLHADGVEYDEKLCEIARTNMKRLKLTSKVVCCDARTFENYRDYDVFYFFNPFVEEVMQGVIDAIVEQCAGKDIMIVYYRPRYPRPIENAGCFELEKELYDSINNYTVNIYHGVIPKSTK